LFFLRTQGPITTITNPLGILPNVQLVTRLKQITMHLNPSCTSCKLDFLTLWWIFH
jgi:hypothetical protein